MNSVLIIDNYFTNSYLKKNKISRFYFKSPPKKIKNPKKRYIYKNFLKKFL